MVPCAVELRLAERVTRATPQESQRATEQAEDLMMAPKGTRLLAPRRSFPC